ncbi:MAG: hypothetical protein JWP88_420 [Flaviaesturariibacter sp.]|nr:hypothetical protein [Flaviaesturariibacter sp.]
MPEEINAHQVALMLKLITIFASAMATIISIKRLLKRKLATTVLIAVSSVAAFATLGEGGKKYVPHRAASFSVKSTYSYKNFSLRSGYNYRSTDVLNNSAKYMMLNTVVTYQKGNATYILPLKKKVFLNDKITFKPTNSRY